MPIVQDARIIHRNLSKDTTPEDMVDASLKKAINHEVSGSMSINSDIKTITGLPCADESKLTANMQDAQNETDRNRLQLLLNRQQAERIALTWKLTEAQSKLLAENTDFHKKAAALNHGILEIIGRNAFNKTR